MADDRNVQVRLKSRPAGAPGVEHFELVEGPLPEPGPGQVLCRTVYLSLDPYMRGRMRPGRSYAKPVKPGEVMCGGTVSQVIRSNAPDLTPGDFVLGYDGWQAFAASDASSLRRLDPDQAPIATALGVLGMPGMTAYVGMLDIGRPEEGETVLVSSAAGAVGSAAGQIAKLRGCRVVGTAGSDAKCAHVVNELGFDAAVNYKIDDLLSHLRRACPDGIDVYFDCVGGAVLDAALRMMNDHGRIPLIGLITQYNAESVPPGPNLMPVLVKRLTVQGMIVGDHADRRDDFLRDMTAWVRDGRVKYRLDIVEGLANAPRAFLGLFRGESIGKRLVRVSDDPTAAA